MLLAVAQTIMPPGAGYDLREVSVTPLMVGSDDNDAQPPAIDAFLHSRIGYLDIPRIACAVLDQHALVAHPSLDELLAADAWARRAAEARSSADGVAATA